MSNSKQSPATTKRATRDGFGEAMLELAKVDSRIMAVSADLTESLRLDEFRSQFPQQYVQVGVAEQNLVGVAAGLALGGKTPFATSFAAFSPGRTFDQIRVSVAYSNLNVKIVGSHAGLSVGPDGATHQMLEDVALMRSLPRMVVVQPCDAQQAHQATHALAQYKGPAYLRLSRPKVETISKPSDHFEIGKAQILRQGVDLSIIASGITVQIALEAARELTKKRLSVRVINMHTLKPLDKQKIIDAANETKAIITIEDHQAIGGLGSATAQVLATEYPQTIKKPVPLRIIAVEDKFGESGQFGELYEKYGLTAQRIVTEAAKFL